MRALIVARELVGSPHRPARLRSSRKTGVCGVPETCGCRFWGRFATQREQAPSPQQHGCLQSCEISSPARDKPPASTPSTS
ncbi:hypothetical protein C1X69_28155 [Pseudomonas sp. FW305-67]|nr:hypothetical protein C1X70_28465 [Pseudomonas sp. FW305-53]PMY84226.1 hypothetical protein C1X68_25630 [Pseudomonas sp. FW303-C2]PMY90122.1 hypothetical protein C1X67_25515 [Pseudomonas sp. FW305-62]PNA39230.1 hypothetical protein C1X71_27010 [Pseudomonas sp. FW306-2-2C-A10BC]PNA81523.1 hypothetical protein C1X66_28160 [Pseudomonas sp. MPR-R3B]PNB11387.1 hypothetical protein C1X69_28155 [Pseudomonas sp. FW305-67]